jgi:subtilase family serine protease
VHEVCLGIGCLPGRYLFNLFGEMVHSHIFMENIPDRPSRDDLRRRSRVDFNYVHEVTFMIHPKDISELTRKLYDVSDPESENYGQHLTRSEVVTMISNPQGCDAVVKYLRLNGATVVSQTIDGDFITASATIDTWERIFDTEFFTFHQTQLNRKIKEVIRAESYSIPRELEAHVKHVLRVVDIPFPLRGGLGSSPSPSSSNIERVAQSSGVRTSSSSSTGTSTSTGTGSRRRSGIGAGAGTGTGTGKRNTESLLALSKKTVTPEKIRQYYNMTNYEGNEYSKQAVYASGGQNLSPIDLRLFQDQFSIIQDVIPIRGNTDHTVCTVESALCAESNLDIQYIMGVSPVSPTIHWYFPGDFADWLVEVSNTTDLPLVLSISYGSQEYRVTQAEHDAFDYQAIKLGVLGVTIFVAAGDDGANGSEVKYLGRCYICNSNVVYTVRVTSV